MFALIVPHTHTHPFSTQCWDMFATRYVVCSMPKSKLRLSTHFGCAKKSGGARLADEVTLPGVVVCVVVPEMGQPIYCVHVYVKYVYIYIYIYAGVVLEVRGIERCVLDCVLLSLLSLIGSCLVGTCRFC